MALRRSVVGWPGVWWAGMRDTGDVGDTSDVGFPSDDAGQSWRAALRRVRSSSVTPAAAR